MRGLLACATLARRAASGGSRRHLAGAAEAAEAELKKTALYDFHVSNGGKMVPFAGWSMPIQYKDTIMDSTVNCRANGSLFDVSHMCGLSLHGRQAIPFLESLVVADVVGLNNGTGTLTVFTNERGGATDNSVSVVTKVTDQHIYLVVNAGCRVLQLRVRVRRRLLLTDQIRVVLLFSHSDAGTATATTSPPTATRPQNPQLPGRPQEEKLLFEMPCRRHRGRGPEHRRRRHPGNTTGSIHSNDFIRVTIPSVESSSVEEKKPKKEPTAVKKRKRERGERRKPKSNFQEYLEIDVWRCEQRGGHGDREDACKNAQGEEGEVGRFR